MRQPPQQPAAERAVRRNVPLGAGGIPPDNIPVGKSASGAGNRRIAFLQHPDDRFERGKQAHSPERHRRIVAAPARRAAARHSRRCEETGRPRAPRGNRRRRSARFRRIAFHYSSRQEFGEMAGFHAERLPCRASANREMADPQCFP
ncbi:hypothetical protein SDC9_137027 [bioreactor metagenome]|uniref:Uncharacterized protein n=1 Tax=bioreactor metagenome TaxID=1076179 RepID=A0A645DMZ8_9ZZZZ